MFTVRNSNGQSAQTSLSVNVGNATSTTNKLFVGAQKRGARSYQAGTKNAVIGEFYFKAPTSSLVTVTGVGFLDNVYLNGNYNVEIASKDFRNISVWDGNILLASPIAEITDKPAGTTQGSFNYENSSFIVLAGSKKIITVKADISETANGSHIIQLGTFGFDGAATSNWSDINDNGESVKDSVVTITGIKAENVYHSADTNKDWKIDQNELDAVISLYNYRSGTARTGEYHSLLTTSNLSYYGAGGGISYISYNPGPSPSGINSGGFHSADSNKDWRISLLELTRVIELKNSSGYKVQAGTEDGFAPIISAIPSITVLSPNGGETFVKNFQYKVSWVTSNIPITNSMTVRIRNVATGQEFLSSENPNTGYAGINIPADFADGKYKLEVKTAVNNVSYMDASNDSFIITAPVTAQCTDSDGGVNVNVAGLTDGRVNGLGSYFNDSSVGTNGGACSGTDCTGVAEGYCSNNAVTNYVYQCPSGYSVNGACAPKPVVQTNPTVSVSRSSINSEDSVDINWTIPFDAVAIKLFLSCPSGVTARYTYGDLSTIGDICGKWQENLTFFAGSTGGSASFTITNTTSNSINIVPNFYIYRASNPNFAVGVSSQITVGPMKTQIVPTITSIVPASGPVGTNITIYGTGFAINNNLYIDNQITANSSYDGTSMQFPIQNLSVGQHTFRIQNNLLNQTNLPISNIGIFTVIASQTVASCTDSDGGINIDVVGLTDGRIDGIGSYFNDSSVASNGGQCSGTDCTAVAEGYCTNDHKVTNYLYQCLSGYSVNGACAARPMSYNFGALDLGASAISAFPLGCSSRFGFSVITGRPCFQ